MPSGKCLHEIFAERVREAPDRIALSESDRHVTYGDLDARAGELARRLRSLGVGPDTLVGLCVDRSIEMIVGLLAILKAGGAYLPIDPAYPVRRIRFLLDDSAVSIVVSVSRAAGCLEGCDAQVVCIDRDDEGPAVVAGFPDAHAAEGNLAYVIYTSGSTGTPKGVLIEHRNVVRLFDRTHDWFRFDAGDVWTLFHSVSFDFSVWEIWGALLHGGRLVIVPSEVARSPGQFRSLLLAQGVTVLNQTPSAFRQLVAADLDHAVPAEFRLKHVIFGGEALDLKMLEPWIARYGDGCPALVNMYGITETTVHVTYRRILEPDLERPGVSPIGVPIPDLSIRLLDTSGEEVEDGMPGEIHVAGAGLARGYLNRPELTAERFVSGLDGTRLYRSGDRAVRMPDGELVYRGRADDQMKVRGFRIEPGEIESCLAAHPQVAKIIVTLLDYGEGDVRLVAYVLPRAGRELTGSRVDELIDRLAERANRELPGHMRPSAYRIVSEIPMTAHGKVDREALRRLAGHERTPDSGSPAPRTATENAIVQIAGQILERREISTTDDLFEMGGTSLAIIRIIREINHRFQVALNGSELEDQATIERLAACVDAALTRGNDRAEAGS